MSFSPPGWPPVSEKEVLKAVKNFEKFIVFYLISLIVFLLSIRYFPVFWSEKILWGIGSFITLFSIAESKYFDIKKNCNPWNLNFTTHDNTRIKLNLNVEKIIQFSWIIGALLLVASKWIIF